MATLFTEKQDDFGEEKLGEAEVLTFFFEREIGATDGESMGNFPAQAKLF